MNRVTCTLRQPAGKGPTCISTFAVKTEAAELGTLVAANLKELGYGG